MIHPARNRQLPLVLTVLLATFMSTGIRAQSQAPSAPLFQKGFPVPQVKPDPTLEIRAEACAPATALRDLEWNNVRALIENAGALWYDRAIDKGAFMVPKEEGVSVVYGGALWLRGISPAHKLKVAAVR